MHSIVKINVALALILLTGCAGSESLTSAGSQVILKDGQPTDDCQLLGKVTASKNNWINNQNTESAAMIKLKNSAGALGANVLYSLIYLSDSNFVDQFYPAPTKLSADAYQCFND